MIASIILKAGQPLDGLSGVRSAKRQGFIFRESSVP